MTNNEPFFYSLTYEPLRAVETWRQIKHGTVGFLVAVRITPGVSTANGFRPVAEPQVTFGEAP